MAQFPAEIQNIFASVQRDHDKRMAEAIKADPVKHQTTRLYAAHVSTSYMYFGDRTGPKFCYAKHPNLAGYFLTWREEKVPNGWQRVEFQAWKMRKDARDVAKHHHTAWSLKHKKKSYGTKRCPHCDNEVTTAAAPRQAHIKACAAQFDEAPVKG